MLIYSPLDKVAIRAYCVIFGAPKHGKNRISLLPILLIRAYNNRKGDLVEWVRWNSKILLSHKLVCTGTTGRLIEGVLAEQLQLHEEECSTESLDVTVVKSGLLGKDLQLGAMIAEGKIDCMIFFWEPLQPHPHDADVKALLRIAVVYNIPLACNRWTADFMISSPLLKGQYRPTLKEYSPYAKRRVTFCWKNRGA